MTLNPNHVSDPHDADLAHRGEIRASRDIKEGEWIGVRCQCGTALVAVWSSFNGLSVLPCGSCMFNARQAGWAAHQEDEARRKV